MNRDAQRQPRHCERPSREALRGTRAARRRGYILLETVVATGLLVVGLAVIGAQVQDSDTSVRKMQRRIVALGLAEQHLAHLALGLVELDSVDDVQEGDFGPRYPDWGWRLTTDDTNVEHMFLLKLDVLYLFREDEYREDDFDYDGAQTVHTVYAMRATPRPVNPGEEFGISGVSGEELDECLNALEEAGILDQSGRFNLAFLATTPLEALLELLPALTEACGTDRLSSLPGMPPPELLGLLLGADAAGQLGDQLGGGDQP